MSVIKLKYVKPKSILDAAGILDEQGKVATVLAGGTDLIPFIRKSDLHPMVLIDINDLGLNDITFSGNCITIGAAATHTTISKSLILQKCCKILVEACDSIGCPSIRNRGTIGGNIVNASPAADCAVALLSLDADLILQSVAGTRTIPLRRFYKKYKQTDLRPNEILTQVIIKKTNVDSRSKFIKIGNRNAMTISIVNIGLICLLDDLACVSDVRIGLGSVSPTPIRAHLAEKLLSGRVLNESAIEECGCLIQNEVDPISDIRATSEYRRNLTKVLIKRTLLEIKEEYSHA